MGVHVTCYFEIWNTFHSTKSPLYQVVKPSACLKLEKIAMLVTDPPKWNITTRKATTHPICMILLSNSVILHNVIYSLYFNPLWPTPTLKQENIFRTKKTKTIFFLCSTFVTVLSAEYLADPGEARCYSMYTSVTD